MNIFDNEGEALEAMRIVPFELHPAIADSEGEAVPPRAMEDQIIQQQLRKSYQEHENNFSLIHRQVKSLARTALKRLFI